MDKKAWFKKSTGGARIQQRRSARFEKLEDRLYLTTIAFTTPSTNGGDGTWVAQKREGVDVYVGPAYLYYNTNPNLFPGFQAGDTLYAKVNYYDEGSGTVRFQYDSVASNFDQTEFHTRSSRVDTQEFVSSYHYLDNVQFANGANGHDFRVVADGAPVASVEISNQPFPDSGLDWVWSPPWEAPYTGPSREVDASTLSGKVLAGYQGWFNTPNDAADEGYVHWGQPGDWSIEQWPDVNDYDQSELFAVPGVSTASGEQAYLFSSANSAVVHRHFQWMREHNIDGVLVQRFRPSFMYKQPDGSYTGEPQWPVVNARDAAHREGRTWAIEYDIQNGGSSSNRDLVIQQVKDDWEYLTDPNGMNMLADSHYQREDGKPVVAIFGLYVNSGNMYSTAQQTDLINYFQSRGVYVVGAGRHSESAGQLANAGLHDAYIPWQGYWKGGDSYAPDEATLNGVTEHIPHVFPGFSWTHLRNDDTATSRDREGGNFYWRMIADAANETDAPWYFIGMFDEYDEGTNLIPGSDDPPVPDTDPQGDPLTYQVSDPRPNDWWLALTGVAKEALQGKISINDTMPAEAELENRSNIGGEAGWTPTSTDRLTTVSQPDGGFVINQFTVDGETFDAATAVGDYLYFQVDDDFLNATGDWRDLTIEVEYLDAGLGQFSLEYDSPGNAYQASDPAPLTGSNEWRVHRFDLADADFGNGQNGGADFRIAKTVPSVTVREVRVVKESVLTVDASLGAVNASNGLVQVEVGDGQTIATTAGGRDVRLLDGTPASLYMYFQANDAFAYQVEAGLNAAVEVVYQDIGTGTLRIQYDAVDAAYRNSDTVVTLENSGEWRTARFYLDDAYFGSRQNNSSDFRILGSNVPIDSVRVLRSFGDLAPPELQSAAAVAAPAQSSVFITWTMADDWKTGPSDQWTVQEDNQVQLEWSDDGGSTWNTLDEVYENTSGASQSGYDAATGRSTWLDLYEWDTSGLAAGTYQVRITPTDGRGNLGDAMATAAFDVNLPPSLAGDYNYDNTVDEADLTVWQGSLGAAVPAGTGADGSMNGIVDLPDLMLWQRNFGATLSPVALFASSEPLSDSASQSSMTVGAEPQGEETPATADAYFSDLSFIVDPTSEQETQDTVTRVAVTPPAFLEAPWEPNSQDDQRRQDIRTTDAVFSETEESTEGDGTQETPVTEDSWWYL